MSYRKKVYRHRSGELLEVMEYHDGMYGAPGSKRQPKRKATPEELRRINQYNKRMRCWRKMINYIDEGDLYTTLTFKPDLRPGSMEAAKKIWSSFLRSLRREYKKAGVELRWFRQIEVGSKGAVHIHVVLKRIPDIDLIIARLWKYGHARNEAVYKEGDMRKLAEYMTKEPEEHERWMSDYDASRNMPIPEPKKSVIRSKRGGLDKKIRVPKGYELDEDSVESGVNPFGYPFRHYLLRKIKDNEKGGRRRCS